MFWLENFPGFMAGMVDVLAVMMQQIVSVPDSCGGREDWENCIW